VTSTEITEPWRDTSRDDSERVADLVRRLTLEEKIGQLGSVWLDATASDAAADGDGDGVAPMQDDFAAGRPPLEDLLRNGIGQVTRAFGTRPVSPEDGARALAALQRRIVAGNRLGIPAVAHEECLTGFAAWTATIFPTPLAWGASFDPELVGDVARAIGDSMHGAGVHQGLAPVLDVTRDPRWGRTEETIGEDPYLVGAIGTAYVTGLQAAGIDATLKHFAGYSASRAGRNMAPVSIGPREFADVLLPPFEMAIRLGGATSVMPSYIDIDGVPASGDPRLLRGTLRGELGFDGLIVSDYYAVSFLELQHGVAATQGDAARLALTAGIDVELPSLRCYGKPLLDAVKAGEVAQRTVDEAVTRVLRRKCALGLLDQDWTPETGTTPVLDPPAHRALARRLAAESVVLLANSGAILPLPPETRVAVVGPLADDPLAFFGCYSMPRHLGASFPEAAASVPVTTLADALSARVAEVTRARGCAVRDEGTEGFAEAIAAARAADVVVAVVGDEAGLFGRGTSGEGCDVTSLRLPGVQQDLLTALTGTGTPVVAVLVTGRPYAIAGLADRMAAIVQAFFPGEEGGVALAQILTGQRSPSGKLPVELPADPAAQPSSYLRSRLASQHPGSSVDPAPLFAFGHGLSYTTFGYSGLAITPEHITTGTSTEISCTVRNTGTLPGTEVVQLYLGDPVAQVVRPRRWLAGFARVTLAPGQARNVTFQLHADRTAFTGLDGLRVVEPGEITAEVGGASDDLPLRGSFTLTGQLRLAGTDRVLDTPVIVA